MKSELEAALEELTEKESHLLTYMEMIDARKRAYEEILEDFEAEAKESKNLQAINSEKFLVARDFLQNQLPDIVKSTTESIKTLQTKMPSVLKT